MLVYIFGVLAGSLTTSIFRPTVYLSGPSGGVYTLITAHLGTVIMNFRYISLPENVRLLCISLCYSLRKHLFVNLKLAPNTLFSFPSGR